MKFPKIPSCMYQSETFYPILKLRIFNQKLIFHINCIKIKKKTFISYLRISKIFILIRIQNGWLPDDRIVVVKFPIFPIIHTVSQGHGLCARLEFRTVSQCYALVVDCAINKHQGRIFFSAQATGVILVKDSAAGKHGLLCRLIVTQGRASVLPAHEVSTDGVAPGYVSNIV